MRQIPAMVREDRTQLIRLIVDRLPEIIIETMKAGSKPDKALLSELIGSTAMQALKELPDPIDRIKDFGEGFYE